MGAEHSDSIAISVCESAIGDEWRAETGLSLPVELGDQAGRPQSKDRSDRRGDTDLAFR